MIASNCVYEQSELGYFWHRTASSGEIPLKLQVLKCSVIILVNTLWLGLT